MNFNILVSSDVDTIGVANSVKLRDHRSLLRTLPQTLFSLSTMAEIQSFKYVHLLFGLT